MLINLQILVVSLPVHCVLRFTKQQGGDSSSKRPHTHTHTVQHPCSELVRWMHKAEEPQSYGITDMSHQAHYDLLVTGIMCSQKEMCINFFIVWSIASYLCQRITERSHGSCLRIMYQRSLFFTDQRCKNNVPYLQGDMKPNEHP